LDEELVAPGVEGLEGLGRVDVVDQDAAVGAAVEGYTERLETFLAGCVPELGTGKSQCVLVIGGKG
jgi:hypothetical protein